MAAVLFIITIPTEAEENRLKTELIAKRTTDMLYIEIPTTKATTPTTPAARDDLNDKEESINTNINEIPTTPIGLLQYATFPKRRKLEKEDGSESKLIMGNSSSRSNSDSLRDADTEVTDSVPIPRKSWEGIREILSSSKRKANKKRDFNIDLPNDTSMEVVLQEILKKFQVHNAVWSKDTAGRMHQIIFTAEISQICENMLDKLHEWGIGERQGSTVSVVNCVFQKTFERKEDCQTEAESNKENTSAQKQGAWDRFMNSVRSRLNVEQIVRDVRQEASITFDFTVLLISAAILAFFGLIENSTIFLASSMLISPLMGPIIAGIFGSVIKDRSLHILGLRNELFGISIATIVGFIFGLIMCSIGEHYDNGRGLTEEMFLRCDLHSLLVGILTAIPSGAAVAVGILGGNIGSLIGVAISASLLPPAVNAGVLWSVACIYKFWGADEMRRPKVTTTHFYSNDEATELMLLGSVSMCITLSNVICVYLMGILVLKIKEIAPVISRNNQQFWKHDIKIARDLNKNGFNTDDPIIDEFAHLNREDQKALGVNCDFLRNIQLDEVAYQNTWSPISSNRRSLDPPCCEPMRSNYLTIHHIERLYSTITRAPKEKSRHKFNISRRPASGYISDFGTSYKLFSENLPRCVTMPSRSHCPPINIPEVDIASCSTISNNNSETNTPTKNNDEQKKRKFIVTPAEDPLHRNDNKNTDEIDV